MGIKDNKKIKLPEAIALLVGGMIGSAIFSVFGLTINYAGPSCIISWILAAIIELFYGLAMAELATTYKKNGGIFSFPMLTFDNEVGSLLGFVSVWGNTMADIISISFSAMYISRFLSFLLDISPYIMIIISIFFIVICYIVNAINISITGKINFMLAIILAILLIIYSYFAITNQSFSMNNFNPFFSQGTIKGYGFLRAVPIAMIAYSSIISISIMADDIENPKKNIPLAVVIGLLITMIIYLIVIFSTLSVITIKELTEANMVFTPLFAVCINKLQNVPAMSIIISLASIIALVTTMIVVMAISGRNIKAAADKGFFPNILSKQNNAGIPIYAITLVMICSIVLSFFPDTVDILINLGAIFIIVTVMINFLSFIYMRKYSKGDKSHYMAPISIKVAFILLIVLICCYVPDVKNGGILLWIFSITWYIIGFVVYMFYRLHNGYKK